MTDIRYQIRSRLDKVGIHYIRCKKIPASIYLQIPFSMAYKSQLIKCTLRFVDVWYEVCTLDATLKDTLVTVVMTLLYPVMIPLSWYMLRKDYKNKDNLKGHYNREYLFGISNDVIKELNLKEYIVEHNYKELP